MIPQHHIGDLDPRIYRLLSTDACAAGITAHVEEPTYGCLWRWLVFAPLPCYLPQPDAFPALVGQHLVAGESGDIAGGIVFLGLYSIRQLREGTEQVLLCLVALRLYLLISEPRVCGT